MPVAIIAIIALVRISIAADWERQLERRAKQLRREREERARRCCGTTGCPRQRVLRTGVALPNRVLPGHSRVVGCVCAACHTRRGLRRLGARTRSAQGSSVPSSSFHMRRCYQSVKRAPVSICCVFSTVPVDCCACSSWRLACDIGALPGCASMGYTSSQQTLYDAAVEGAVDAEYPVTMDTRSAVDHARVGYCGATPHPCRRIPYKAR